MGEQYVSQDSAFVRSEKAHMTAHRSFVKSRYNHNWSILNIAYRSSSSPDVMCYCSREEW
eukprot:scaffold2686_cov267-Chaetoceros_neogracile.AAC.9